jgi:hypothetical protein
LEIDMSNKFDEIRKKMEELSSKKEPAPFTIKKAPVAKSGTPSSDPSSKNQASIAKTLEDKGQSEGQFLKKQDASDDGLWQDGEGIVTRRIKEAAAKEREVQSEKDAKVAAQLQKAEEAQVKLRLQDRPSEAAGTAATLQLMQELDAKEKAARIEAEREDAEMAQRLQQEEEAGVRLRLHDQPSEEADPEFARQLSQFEDAKPAAHQALSKPKN